MRTSFKILLLAIFCIFSGCTKKVMTPFRVGTNSWPGYEPLYIAAEKKLFADQPIEIVRMGSASEVIEALAQGRLEAGCLTTDETILLADKGIPAKIKLVLDVSNGADGALAKPEVKGLANFKGLRVGVESTALGAYFLARIIEIAKLNEKDLTIVPVNIDKQLAMVKENRIDAVITFEPVKTQIEKLGWKVALDSASLSNEIVDVLVVPDRSLKDHAESIATLQTGWYKALEFLESNPTDSHTIMSKNLKISPEEVKASLKTLIYPSRDKNRAMLDGQHALLKSTVKKLASVMKTRNLIKDTIAEDSFFNNEK